MKVATRITASLMAAGLLFGAASAASPERRDRSARFLQPDPFSRTLDALAVSPGLITVKLSASATSADELRPLLEDCGVFRLERLLEGDSASTRAEQLAPSGALELRGRYLEFEIPAGKRRKLLRALRQSSLVDAAYLSPLPAPPPGATGVDPDPATPDFVDHQLHLIQPPFGLGAFEAWSIPGARGEGVTIVDVEYSWRTRHEDLTSLQDKRICFTDRDFYRNHGTAVAGVLSADENHFGMTGMVPDAELLLASQYPPGRSASVARAIYCALEQLERGDIILVEAQAYGPGGQLVPVEWHQAEFDAIAEATSRGIIVIEAAGNGNQNLDAAKFQGVFNRNVRDSGAILVGGGAVPNSAQPEGSRLNFSNHGSRVDLQSWGEYVATTGYGALWNGGGDPNQAYTSRFSGTSSASALVAGLAASIQGVQRARGAAPLDSRQMRALLVESGAPQQAGPHQGSIGPRPDARRALNALSPVWVHQVEIDDAAPGGNGNGLLDPGETVDLNVHLISSADEPVRVLHGELLTDLTPSVRITGHDVGWPLLYRGQPQAGFETFRMTVQPQTSCGASLPFELALSLDEGNTRLPLRLDLLDNCEPMTCDEPAPRPSLPTLRAAKMDGGVRWSWLDEGIAGYRLWRSHSATIGQPRLVGETDANSIEEPFGNSVEAPSFYLMRGINRCGWEQGREAARDLPDIPRPTTPFARPLPGSF